MTHERKDGNTVNKEIPLTRCMFAIVDIEDYNNISGYKWYSRNHRGLFYAGRNITIDKGKQTTILMSRQIMGITNPVVSIDHINHNTLDNRRNNLRVCNHRINMHNVNLSKTKTSKYIGVNLMSDRPRYRAELQVFGKKLHLGVFEDEADAHAAYCGAVKSNEDILSMYSSEEYNAST